MEYCTFKGKEEGRVYSSDRIYSGRLLNIKRGVIKEKEKEGEYRLDRVYDDIEGYYSL